MTKRAELPDGTILEFPDETPDAVMDRAVKSHLFNASAKPAAPPRSGTAQGRAANQSDFAALVSGRAPARSSVEQALLTNQVGNAAAAFGFPQLNEFSNAVRHHGLNAVHGLAQLGVRGLEGIGIAPEGTTARDQAVMAQREAQYQATTPDSPASYAGAAVGELAPWLTGVGQLRAAGLLPTVTATGLKGAAIKGGLLGAEGAAMGAATPVLEGDFDQQKLEQVGAGTVLAPLAAGGIKAVGALGSGARGALRYLTPGGREAIANQRIAEQFGTAPETLAALRAPSPVAGFPLTPAQAIGTPEAVQAERILRNQRDTAPLFAQADAQQNQVLRQQVAQIAGSPEAMAAARRARSEATDPVFAQLPTAQVDPLPVLAALDSLGRSGLGQGKNVRTAIGEIQSGIQQQVQNGTLSADVLSGIRERLNSYLGPMATGQEKTALGPIKTAIVDALDAAVPGYRDNLAAYARLSAPLKDMAVGRELLAAIDNSRLDAAGNPVVDLTKVRSALAKAKKSEHPPSPQAIAQLENVMRAIQQRGITNNTVAASGPGTAADALRGIGGPIKERLLAQLPAAAGAGLGGLPGYTIGLLAGEGVNAARGAVQRRVGQKAVSAQATADAIEAATRKRNPQSLLPQHGMPAFLLPYLEP